ncbi:MAG: hypothetical protein EA399_11225 [Desulfovibrionales bacterium]|nr:MAG: hypothetical protein EA399_11225 [Desulfovibrionales bacterium]
MRLLQKVPFPAKTCGVILLNTLERLDSGFRRNDEFQGFATFCSNIIVYWVLKNFCPQSVQKSRFTEQSGTY